MDYRYHGIIIGKYDVGEVDRIYTVYTREAGKIRLLGKGVKKPNAKLAGNLEPLTRSEIFMAKKRGMGNVTGVIGLDFFPHIKADLSATQKTFFVFGVLAKIITEQEKDEKVFDLLHGYLKTAEDVVKKMPENKENKLDILAFGFILKLFSGLGYLLEAGQCVVCKKKLSAGENFFSAEKGGILCVKCARSEQRAIRISDGAVKLMRIILKNRVENFPKIEASGKDIASLKIAVQEEISWISG